MKTKFTIIIISCIFVNLALANSFILKQGNIDVTIKDLDGYAYKIPIEHRGDYFNSIQRLEKSLYSIMNMKHIVRYGKEQGLVNETEVDITVNERIFEYFPHSDKAFSMQEENKIILLKNFLKKEEAYKQIQKKITTPLNKDDLLELAEEKYIANKNSYKIHDERTLDFIAIIYNENNKLAQAKLAQKLHNDINGSVEKFKELKQGFNENKEVNIEIHKDIKFQYNIRNKEYSDKVYAIDSIGVLPEIINYNNRFFIAQITNIQEEKIKPFEDVKQEIIKSIKKEYADRKFNSLMISLTKDEIEVNKDILPSLKSRYLNKEN